MANRCGLCQCEQCSALPPPTWTQAYARACEARYVGELPYYAREEFYAGVLKLRGASGLRDLMGRVDHESRTPVRP